MEDSNRSSNPSIHQVSGLNRRHLLLGGVGSAVTGLLAPLAGCATAGCRQRPAAGLQERRQSPPPTRCWCPTATACRSSHAWGDPVGLSGENPAFKPDASNSAAEQEAQLGMHHDGIHFFAQNGSSSGLLVMNHEYTDDGLLHADGMATWTAAKVRKAQAAHGVSVIEVAQKDGRWDLVRPSPWARRITASTPMQFSGPAAGHALLKTAADASGHTRARHPEQLRQRHHALGHLPDLRRELHQLLQGPGHTRRARTPLGPAQGRPGRLPLARTRRTLRRHEEPERAEPLRLGRRDRPLQPEQHARQAHRAGPRGARRRHRRR